MERSSRNLLLKAVFGLVLLAVFGQGANGQTTSTSSDLGNATLTSNTTGTQVSETNTTAVTSFSGQTDPEDNAIPDDAYADGTSSFNDSDWTTTSADNMTSSAANVTGTETSPGAESEDWGMNMTQPSPENNGVHGMSVDSPLQDSPTENTTAAEDSRYENTTSEDAPTEGTPTEVTPTEDYPTENATTHDTPSWNTTSTENTTADDTYTEEDTTPADTTPAEEEESPFDGIPTEAAPAEDEVTAEDGETAPVSNTTATSSSDLEFAPGIAANDTTDTVDEDVGEDTSNATLDDATEVSVDDMTNATATDDTDTTYFDDDGYDDDDDEWGDEWDVPTDDTTPEPYNVTDTSFNDTSFNDTSPADNVTTSEETNTANVTSPDTDFTNETTPFDDDDYYNDDDDDEYYDDYEEVNEDDDMTSANETDEGSDTVTSDDSGDVTPSNVTSTSSNDTSADDSVPSNGTSVYDADTSNGTEEVTPQAPEKADFVVYDSTGSPCLLASLNITIHFKYTVQEGLVREMYETVSKKNTQDGSSYQGSCEDQQSSLSITWNNSTFTLNLTFSLKDKDEAKADELDMDVLPPGANTSAQTWSLQQVSLSYDTANEVMFPGAYNPSVKKVTAGKLSLFQTPLGLAYMCRTPEVVKVEFKDVDLAFNFLHLMPFAVTNQYFSNVTVECSGDLSSVPVKEESYTVPLVVAAVLASIVIAILVVYATVRCVTRRMRQADYKQME